MTEDEGCSTPELDLDRAVEEFLLRNYYASEAAA